MKNYDAINDGEDVIDKNYADDHYSAVGHTHNHAGSSSPGGAANSAIADSTGADIASQFANVKNDIAINKTTLGVQCKNLFNPNAVNWYQPTKTSIAKDGTITSTVTSDSRVWSIANAEYFMTLSAGKYIVRTVTETIDNTASNLENIRGYKESGTQLFDIYPNVIGTKTASFTLTETATIAIMFKLFTQTCKIMIHDADITDVTYEPYKESVYERLIKNKSDIAVNRTTLGYTTKNLLKITTASKSGNGVTITVNDDKSITVNGTATSAGVYAVIGEADVIAGNKYILNGGVGSSTTYGLYTENFGTVHNFGSDNVYIPNATGKAVFRIFIRPGVTISNVTFKPMLRYADIIDDTYEPYIENVNTRINNIIANYANYLPISGGTISGNLTVGGALKTAKSGALLLYTATTSSPISGTIENIANYTCVMVNATIHATSGNALGYFQFMLPVQRIISNNGYNFNFCINLNDGAIVNGNIAATIDGDTLTLKQQAPGAGYISLIEVINLI